MYHPKETKEKQPSFFSKILHPQMLRVVRWNLQAIEAAARAISGRRPRVYPAARPDPEITAPCTTVDLPSGLPVSLTVSVVDDAVDDVDENVNDDNDEGEDAKVAAASARPEITALGVAARPTAIAARAARTIVRRGADCCVHVSGTSSGAVPSKKRKRDVGPAGPRFLVLLIASSDELGGAGCTTALCTYTVRPPSISWWGPGTSTAGVAKEAAEAAPQLRQSHQQQQHQSSSSSSSSSSSPQSPFVLRFPVPAEVPCGRYRAEVTDTHSGRFGISGEFSVVARGLNHATASATSSKTATMPCPAAATTATATTTTAATTSLTDAALASPPLQLPSEAAAQTARPGFDVGTWCSCGRTVYVASTGVDQGTFVQCEECAAWSHARCVRFPTSSEAQDASPPFVCRFCRADAPNAALIGTGSVRLMISMLTAAQRYARSGDAASWDSFCDSPPEVAALITSAVLNPRHHRRCADLGAGIGSLSACLPAGSLCVERAAERVRVGRARVPEMNWHRGDALGPAVVARIRGSMDLVVCNPDFEVAAAFLYVAMLALDRANPHARAVFLLPSDFFETAAIRARVYAMLDITIETELRLGRLAYRLEDTRRTKMTADSLFVLRRGRDKKFEHSVVNARGAGFMAAT
jgi:hypothetical protein